MWDTGEIISSMGVDKFMNELMRCGETAVVIAILLLILAVSAVLGVVASVIILSGADGGGLLEVSGLLIIMSEIALWSALYFAGAGYSHTSEYSSRLCKMRKESQERY